MSENHKIKNYLNVILYNFENSIKNGKDTVYIGYDINDIGEMIDYWVEKKDWTELLEILIDLSSEIEEYELSIEFKKIKDNLSL